MTNAEVTAVIRAQGLCGRIVNDGNVCVMPRGHDSNLHDRGWHVVQRRERPVYAFDSRDADDIFYDVTEVGGKKVFSSLNGSHADWLASTLTRLDL